MLRSIIACLLAGAFPAMANAAVWNATSSNLNSIFTSAQSGDTINLSGSFGATWLMNRTFAARLTINATNAVFTDTLTIDKVTGMTIIGGKFGSPTEPMRSTRTVIVQNSNGVKLQSQTFIGNGKVAFGAASQGVMVRYSNNVQVSAGTFSNFLVGLAIISSTNIKADSSRFSGMTSDGINIIDSRFVTATANTCSASIPAPGAHPDCIQLWSIAGNPVQSDIALLRNIANGATQGFTSFNADDGGGLRISMIGNIVTTSFPQGVACYNCSNSIFSDNILKTVPGSLYQTSINIVGGTNNIITNNNVTAYRYTPTGQADDPDALGLDSSAFFDEPAGLLFADDASASQTTRFSEDDGLSEDGGFAAFGAESRSFGLSVVNEAVPEPAIWAQVIVGFGLVGALARCRKDGFTPLPHCSDS